MPKSGYPDVSRKALHGVAEFASATEEISEKISGRFVIAWNFG